MRRFVVPAAVIALAFALTVVALRDASEATLPVDLQVTSTTDPFGLGATTRATVEVYNRGDRDVRPRFSVSWLPYPYFWRTTEGPAVLAPGERATYVIEAPAAVAAPPDGQAFHIKVNDPASIVYAVSASIEKPKPSLPIVNPSLRSWTQRDPATGLVSPAGWGIFKRLGDGDSVTIEEKNALGVEGMHIRLVQDGRPDPNGWTHTGLTQQIAFPSTAFSVRALSVTPYLSNAAGWPLNAFGIEVSDAENGVIWVLFQQTGNGDREYDLPTGHHIKVFDVPFGQWATRSIDLAAIYRDLNWAPPEIVALKIFAAASSSEPAEVEGYFGGITPVQ